MINLIKKMTLIIGIILAFSPLSEAKIIVFAAASMTNVLQEVAEEYKKTKRSEEIIFSFASSSVLARQIAEGAPANLFISADQKWMDFIAEKNAIIDAARMVLVTNRLVMIAPKESKIDTVNLTNNKWLDYLNNTFLAVGDPDHVPAGIYTKAAFTHLQQWAEVENKLARTDNVRAALVLIERAEAPLGVVYLTDALASQKVKVVATFPADTHPVIEYPVAIVKENNNKDTQAFLDYLTSSEAKKIFVNYGFEVKNR